MRAWVCERLDGIAGLVLRSDWPDAPDPGPDEVRVMMRAAALNYPDLLMLSGGYQFVPPLPFVPGMEGCATVAAIGARVDPALLGARVLVTARTACLAEALTLPAAAVRAVPAGLDDAGAAAHGVALLTAYVALTERGRLLAGERLLVTGAGGGVGLAAVALGRSLGAHVTAVTTSADKAGLVEAAGAQAVVVAARDGTGMDALKGSMDCVYDPVGGALFASALASLRWGGRYLLIGFVGGRPAPLPLNRVLLKGIEVIGVRAGEQGRQDPAAGARHLAEIDRLAEQRGLRAHIGMTLPFEKLPDAFAAMADGTLAGKAVILMP